MSRDLQVQVYNISNKVRKRIKIKKIKKKGKKLSDEKRRKNK